MKSPIFFSKGRSVRFWIQILLVLALVRIAIVPSALYANPTGEQVVGGAAGFNRPDAATLIINQHTDRAVINWNDFSIANGELTKFVQPSSTSAVLNRVVTITPSMLNGALEANGHVWLSNPNGIMQGKGGTINVGSFVASTHDIGTEDFMKGGDLNLKGDSDASIVNQGNITAREGDVFLIAKEVKNEGQLMAKDGTVGMVSGTEVSLQSIGQGNYKVRLMTAENGDVGSPSQRDSKGSAEIVNEGVIQAANAVLEAKGSYLPMAIKNTGVIEATGLVENGDGSVTLTGGEGDILNTGVVVALQRSLDGQRETGGSIMMTAKNVTSDLGSVITAAGRDGGGTVKLRSADTTILRGSIEVVGTAESAKGGQVQLLGERVGLFERAKVDASGGAGGGEILVGGDYQGKNVDVQNALKTFVGEGVGLFADSKSGGDGGKVIVWADEWTKFYGDAQVNGYLNGGFTEISGKQYLDFDGVVGAKGLFGNSGKILFDPINIQIGTTAGVQGNNVPPAPITTATVFSESPPPTPGILSIADLTGALANANVEVIASGVMQILNLVTIQAGRILTLSGGSLSILAEVSGEGTLDLSFTGTVSQTLGTGVGIVSVNNLVLRSATVDLNTELNEVSNLAATTGTISFANSGGINISSLAYKGGTANGIESATSVTLLAGGDITQSAPVGDSSAAVPKSVGTLRAGTFGGGNIFLDNIINDVDNLSLRTQDGTPLVPDPIVLTSSFIRFSDVDGFVIQNWTPAPGGVSGGILTAKGGTTLLPTGGSVVLGAGQGPDNDPPVTQAPGARINASNLGLLGKADYTLTEATNDIYTIAANLTNAGDLSYSDANGFQVFYVDFDPALTTHDVFIPGIQLAGRGTDPYTGGNLTLLTQAGAEYDGIQLTATGFVSSPLAIVTIARTITAANQYDLLATFTSGSAPGHIEASGDVLITVGNTANTDFSNRFTLQEGIHLFAGMNPGLTGFGNAGNATVVADNMTIGSDTRPDLAMHGLIMTGNVNEAGTVPFATGTFFRPYTDDRQAYIVTTKANYAATPNPGELQLTQAELRRVNSNRLQVRSSFTDASQPAVDVRTPLNLYGLYDTVEVSGLFPTNPGVNRLELIAGGASNAATRTFSNVQVSADISSDVNQLPMDIFLSASQLDDQTPANNQTSGGKVFVNAGLRSYGGQIGLQGQNVNINAAVNANNPNFTDGLGLVAIFPGRGPNVDNLGTGVPTRIFLGSKDSVLPPGPLPSPNDPDNVLGILRTELALITAGTVQIGDVELKPAVLSPVNPFTRSAIVGTDPLWKNDIQGVDAGSITVTDLISSLSFDTLALVTSGGLSQDPQAGLQVPGLFVVGNPAVTTTDYVLDAAFNSIDRLAVALGLATPSGAPSGDLLLVNQKGLVGGNGGEVARIQQQWDQGYTRTTTTPFLSTGVGLVVARALSITAAGPVSIYETVPTGVTGLGYIGHVASNPNGVANGSNGYAQVGNQIGLLGDNTSGLAINVIQNAPGDTAANNVWAAAARGLSINDLTGEFGATAAEAGILTNGGQVTLEGNAIEIANTVSRVPTSAGDFSANTITIDTTGALTTDISTAVAPTGARVVIRPATGENGFQNRPGSGAFDPNLQNSPLSGAPVEMNLGTGSTVVTITSASGSGLLATPLIDTFNGSITGYTIFNGGTGYVSGDQVTNVGSGTGAINWIVTAVGGVVTAITGGVAGSGYGGGFLDTSLGTVYLDNSALENGAIRASVMEIGRNTDPATATGKFSITSDIGVVTTMSSLLGEMHLISGGAVEDSGMVTLRGTPNTITMNLNGTSGNGGLAVEALGAVALQGDVSVFATDAGANNNVRFIDALGGVSIGVVDGVSGVLANTFYLNVTGGIAQASGATIQAASGGISVSATGAIRLDQGNDFNLVAVSSPSSVYLRSAGPMSVSIFGSGQPGGQPGGVTGITGSNVTLAAGGDLQQSNLAAISATGSFLATVLDGSDVLLNSTLNTLGVRPVIAALKADGTLGNIANLTLVNNGALVLGSAGLLTADLAAAGSGWTQAPTVTVSGSSTAVASVSTVMGLNAVAISSGGSGYQSAPLVTLTDGGGTGVGASAVAIVDTNPLSSTYGQVTSINITNAGTGYTGTVTASLSGGGATQDATAGTITLAIQRLNVSDPGIGYTSTPTITFTGGGGGSGATATAVIGGTGGYVASGSTTVLGGITGNLNSTTTAGGITSGSGLSVAGTTTLTDNSGVGIILGNQNNNLQGVLTITESGAGPVTISNKNGLILGDIKVGVGALTMTSLSNGITQSSTGNSIVTGGNASFYAVNTSGIANGPVIFNNSLNSFGGSVAATGTRVVIRDSTALVLGAVTASTSLTATSTSAGITQTGVISSTGAASFAAAANQSIILADSSNVFGSTVSLRALSGQLRNVTVTDSTALNLQALNILGDLVATGAGLTQSGILQAANADLRSTGAGNSLNLSTFNNIFSGEVRIRSDGNASLFDNGPLIIGNLASSQVTGNLTLSSAGAFSQTQSLTVNGTGTSSISTTVGGVTFSQNIALPNGNLTVAPATTFTQSGGTLSLGTGTLSISSTGLVEQTGGNMVVAGTATVNSGGAAITLTSATNDFQGAVTLTGGVTQITDGVGGLTLGTLNTGNLTAISTGVGGVLNLGQGNVTGTLVATTNNGNISQGGILTITGLSTLTAGTGSIVLGRANSLANVTVNSATDVTLRNIALTAGTLLYPTLPATLQNLTLIFDNSAATLSANPSNLTGSLSITAGGGAISSVFPITVNGTTTLNAGSSAITFDNAANDFVGTVTIGGTGVVTMKDANNLTLVGQQSLNLGNITTVGAFTVSSPANITSASGTEINTGGTITLTAGNNADVKVDQDDSALIGSVNVAGTFTLRTDATIGFTLGGAGGFGLSAGQLNNFRVGTFAPVADGANITILTAFNYGGIPNLSLTTLNSGNIIANGAVSVGTLSLSSAGTASFTAVNSISSLGTVSIGSQGLTFRNNRGLNLGGTARMPGRLSLEVAGQFYNQTGQSQPLGGVAGGSVIKSLSLMGGLPNQVSGLAGFSYRYDGQLPTSGNVMSYAVSPLTMFAPGGTTIAGVDLSGTQTGGGQLNTFLTGSDNLNWMISDFGRFDMPTVKPSGMDYILYPQRVEPETRTLPAATLGQLERELGRPPTFDEIQAREVAAREASILRSRAILEKSSFDALEDEVDKQESAEVPAQVIDGGKPQADSGGQRSEDGMQKAEVGSRESAGVGPQAKKTQSVRQGSNGPILRSGPIRSVAHLRPAEPAEGTSAGKITTQAANLDAKSVMEQERASAEVGIAPPIAAGR